MYLFCCVCQADKHFIYTTSLLFFVCVYFAFNNFQTNISLYLLGLATILAQLLFGISQNITFSLTAQNITDINKYSLRFTSKKNVQQRVFFLFSVLEQIFSTFQRLLRPQRSAAQLDIVCKNTQSTVECLQQRQRCYTQRRQ